MILLYFSNISDFLRGYVESKHWKKKDNEQKKLTIRTPKTKKIPRDPGPELRLGNSVQDWDCGLWGVYVFSHVCVCVCVCMCVCVRARARGLWGVYVCTNSNTCIYTYMHRYYMQTDTYIIFYIHVCVFVCVCACVCAYTHTYITRIRTHPQSPTHKHTHRIWHFAVHRVLQCEPHRLSECVCVCVCVRVRVRAQDLTFSLSTESFNVNRGALGVQLADGTFIVTAHVAPV